jgi:hypothetical protein
VLDPDPPATPGAPPNGAPVKPPIDDLDKGGGSEQAEIKTSRASDQMRIVEPYIVVRGHATERAFR